MQKEMHYGAVISRALKVERGPRNYRQGIKVGIKFKILENIKNSS